MHFKIYSALLKLTAAVRSLALLRYFLFLVPTTRRSIDTHQEQFAEYRGASKVKTT